MATTSQISETRGSINNTLRDVEADDVEEIGMIPAFVMATNFIIGAGLFSMPYVFYHSGILAGVATLLIVTCTLIITSNWTLEICSRAQALDTVIRESGIPDLTFQDVSMIGRRNDSITAVNSKTRLLPLKPQYEIKSSRKFEFTELMEIFFGKPGRIITAFFMIIYMSVTMTAYATIFASTWSLIMPYNNSIPTLGECFLKDFDGFLPTGACLNSYRFSIAIFACIVVPTTALSVSTMKPIQMTLSFCLQFTLILGTLHCIYGIAMGHVADLKPGPHPTHLASFDFKSFLNMIPIVVYSQVLHEGIPMIAQPARDKTRLHKLFGAALVYSCFIYASFSVCVALRYRDIVAPAATLNWTHTKMPGNPIFVRIISYMIMMTPSIAVCAAFPLCALTLVCNMFILITGRDVTHEPQLQTTQKVIKMVISLFAVVCGLWISNLKTISKYAGLIAFVWIMIIPIMLQVASRRKCRRVFGKVDQWIEESIAASVSWKEEDRLPLLDKYARLRDVMTMTPYYSSWWSRTWVVFAVLGVTCVMFTLGTMAAFTVTK